MRNRPFYAFMNSVDEMTIAKKTTLLFTIMMVGMLFIGSFAHMSINRIKNNFDILYTKRMLPTIRLENLKDIYTVNVLDTIRDIESGLISVSNGKVVIALAQELIAREIEEYKSSLEIDDSDWLVKLARSWGFGKDEFYATDEELLLIKIEKKTHTIDAILLKMFGYYELKEPALAIDTLQKELYPSVYSINTDLTALINLTLDGAKKGFAKTEQVYNNTFEWIVFVTIGTIAIAAFLAIVLLQNIRLLHARLAKMVDEKTQELQQLNRDLELRVQHEVEQSRQKDQIMFHQSRLASMGEMIGNIAHQWRQPLNALVLIIQSFSMKKMAGLELSDEFVQKQSEEGIALASMMSNTIDDFRNFFKPNRQEELFSLQESLCSAIKLVHEYYEKLGISISLNVINDVHIKGYPNEFSQAMMNLFSNSRDSLAAKDMDEKLIEVTIDKEGENALVCVIDNGGGISDDVINRVFEPYFTTKHKASGTGIGLYMSKQIIEKQMQGKIRASNIKYLFLNKKEYENCAMMTVLVPLQKEKGEEDEL